MKKLFTLITLFAGTVAAMGTDYTDKLVVNINNTATVPVTTTISVEEQPDGNCVVCGNSGKHKIYFGKQY